MRWIKSWLLNLGLWPRLALAVSLGLIVLFVGFLILGEQALQNNIDQIRDERLVIARMAANQINGLLIQAISELEQVRNLVDFKATDPDLAHKAQILSTSYNQVGLFHAGIFVLDPVGEVVVSFPHNLYPSGTNLADQSYIEQAIAQRNGTISEPFGDPLNNVPVSAVVVPIFDEGQLLGFLCGLLDLTGRSITQPLQEAATIGQTEHAALVDSQGRILASTFKLPFLSPGEHETFYRQAIAQGKPTIDTVPFERAGVPNETLGHQHVMAFAPLDNKSWGVTVGGDIEEIFIGVQRLRTGLMLLGIITLVCIWTLTLIGTRRLVRPVQHLTVAAQNIAHGHLETPLRVTEGGEIGLMAEALEEMRQQLMANIKELTSWNKMLKSQVEAQIEELYQQQQSLFHLDQTIHMPLGLEEMLEQILYQSQAASQATQGAIFLYKEEIEDLQPVVVHGVEPEQLDDLKQLAAQATTSQENIVITIPSEQPYQTSSHPMSIVVVPIILEKSVSGAFLLVTPDSHVLSERQITLLSTIASQTALIIHNDQLYSQIEGYAILEERSRLAREMHDGMVQSLGYLKMQLSRIQGWVEERDLPRLEKEVINLHTVLEEVYGEARDAIVGLRIGLNSNDTLEDVLTEYIQGFSVRYRLPVTISVDGETSPLQPHTIFHLLRILQEGLTNIRKHAQASQAWVILRYRSPEFILIIGDNGRGFNPQTKQDLEYWGLQFMHERVVHLGGEMIIHPRPSGGTEIWITLQNSTAIKPLTMASKRAKSNERSDNSFDMSQLLATDATNSSRDGGSKKEIYE